jgi:hypothetical protein
VNGCGNGNETARLIADNEQCIKVRIAMAGRALQVCLRWTLESSRQHIRASSTYLGCPLEWRERGTRSLLLAFDADASTSMRLHPAFPSHDCRHLWLSRQTTASVKERRERASPSVRMGRLGTGRMHHEQVRRRCCAKWRLQVVCGRVDGHRGCIPCEFLRCNQEEFRNENALPYRQAVSMAAQKVAMRWAESVSWTC